MKSHLFKSLLYFDFLVYPNKNNHSDIKIIYLTVLVYPMNYFIDFMCDLQQFVYRDYYITFLFTFKPFFVSLTDEI